MDERLRQARWKVGAYLFLGALAVRLCYLTEYAGSPFFWSLSLDALYHDQLAQGIAAGQGPAGAYFRAPLYYYFLGGVYALFGHSLWAARVVQACLGAASCVLLYGIGQRLFRPAVGLVAAVSMALYGPLVFFDGELLTPVLEVSLDLGFLWLALRAAESRSRTAWLAAGVVLGLSAITRPNILVVTPLALFCIWRGREAVAGLYWRRACVMFLGGVLLAPGLVTARNYAVSGDPVFIASQGGINLFLGNRAEADGFTPSTPQRYAFHGAYQDSVALYGQRAAEEALEQRLTASESQRYWLRRVLRWWREEPRKALRLTGKKMVLAWSHREIRNNRSFEFVRAEFAPSLWLFAVGFWCAGPLGLLGMGLAWRGAPRLRIVVVGILLYVASYVVFFVADRYRLPVVPLLLLFGAYALAWLLEQMRERAWPRLVPGVAALAGLALFVNGDWYRTVTPETRALDHWGAGNAYQQQGHLAEAIAHHRKALALNPSNGEIWTNLGVDQYYSGRLAEATESFRQAQRLGPPSGSLLYNLAMCELQMRRPERARRYLTQAV
jgi:4-amino-4-deoxy-L-arabinose transferase-like glycosyltransferase